MAKKLKIVNAQGQLMSYLGQKMIFDPQGEPKVSGMTERERAESTLSLLSMVASNGPFHIEEFE